ncbi:hypothetical protein CO661_24405 [Sinorhizobium fredii]|uniref:Uncharacterized protein n=1 Tax=Rhizobium fredii TaxID=380 RepID=A0A2A6LSE0_RHIFR|nr:hypothetical protein CO661_24405 [Sinorhizobium fredii]
MLQTGGLRWVQRFCCGMISTAQLFDCSHGRRVRPVTSLGGLATFSVEPRAIQIGRSGQSRASGQSHCISIT